MNCLLCLRWNQGTPCLCPLHRTPGMKPGNHCGYRQLQLGLWPVPHSYREEKAPGNGRMAALFLRGMKCAAVQAAGRKGLSVELWAAGTCNTIQLSSSFSNPSFKAGKAGGLQTLGWFYWSPALCLESQAFPLELLCLWGYELLLCTPQFTRVIVAFTSFIRRDHPGLR